MKAWKVVMGYCGNFEIHDIYMVTFINLKYIIQLKAHRIEINIGERC